MNKKLEMLNDIRQNKSKKKHVNQKGKAIPAIIPVKMPRVLASMVPNLPNL